MNCCTNCFRDGELVGHIYSNSLNDGTCDFCNTSDTKILNVSELEEKFLPLISVFESISDSEVTDALNPDFIHLKIQEYWSIFNPELEPDTHLNILKQILSNSYGEDSDLFNKKHELKVTLHKLDTDRPEREWELFANEIKSNNRFFLGETIDLDLLENLFRQHVKAYSKGKYFYRGRISTDKGFDADQMGKPPKDKSTSGRANPFGIPYLYVSTDPETVLYEARATHSDFITIARFRLTDNIKVLKLRSIDDLSPFILEDNLDAYLKERTYLYKLESELSKPLRRHEDHKLHYLPTQYLCEFVKSLGYEAIEYGSALLENGINLAIFDDSKLEISDLSIHEITSIKLDTHPQLND